MDIWFYIVATALVILLIMYIIKTRLDKGFREKMIPLLKKQKATIDQLEKERDELVEKKEDLSRELNVLQTKFSRQHDEYDKIHWVIKNIYSHPTDPESESKSSGKTLDQQNQVSQQDIALIEATDWWFRKKYLKEDKELKAIEITNLLFDLCNQLNSEFDHKKLTFVQHTGEPIMVESNQKILSQIFLAYGRLIGNRSVSGNSIYVDLERTGKKCLISLEDASHGPDDVEIKGLFSETWLPGKLPDMPSERIAPIILSRELIGLHQGNVWHSRIQEVGIKITFSIPLNKSN